MNTNRPKQRRTIWTLCAALTLPAMAALLGVQTTTAQAAAPFGLPPGPPPGVPGGPPSCDEQVPAAPIPDEFDGYLVYMSNGEVDLTDLSEIFYEGDLSFFHDIMGMSPTETQDFIDDRLALIESRFGIPDPANNPDVAVLIGTTNTDNRRYIAYTVGGRSVPSSGWDVREGAILVVVTNPAGIDLGGQWTGTHVPAGTNFSGGMYNIEVTDACGEPTGEEIEITFVATHPIVPSGPGNFTFRFFCELESYDFPGPAPGLPARGLAEGLAAAKPIPGSNLYKLNTRNVLTFSHDPSLGFEFDGY